MMIRRLATLALPLASLALAHTASAQTTTVAVAAPPPSGSVVVVAAPTNPDDVSRPGGSVAAVAGLGFLTGGGGAGFAFGVEGGYTFPFHLYVGGAFTYKVGGFNSWVFEPQVGYELGPIAGLPMMIRPYLGLGYESFSVGSAVNSGCNGNSLCEAEAGAILNSVSTSFGGFVISPGAVLHYYVTPHWYVGGDVRFDIGAYAGSDFAINLLGTGGYKF